MKKLIPFAALGLLGVIVTSCGGSSTWTLENALSDGELNYALLIGQIDHNDSAARTAGIREALNTRGTATTNANTEDPVTGSIEIGGKTYEVNEVVHGEQKSTAGVTWDAQTATTSTESWLNAYSNIDFFISNNDGMAEAATAASNWVEGMPIFGYDSNQSTLQMIKDGVVMGTINQNAPAQAAAIFMAARNAIDGLTPAEVVTKGFTEDNPNGYGKLTSTISVATDGSKALLAQNVAVTADNVDQFMASDITTLAEKTIKNGNSENANIYLSYYSETDTFLTTSMQPLFEYYDELFDFTLNTTKGDGTDDTKALAALDTATNVDAYIINMVKTTSTEEYLNRIATKEGATEANPTSKPVIFWNRQGTKADNTVDTEVMADGRFEYIYYVGFDAIQGGELQGEMIVDYFQNL